MLLTSRGLSRLSPSGHARPLCSGFHRVRWCPWICTGDWVIPSDQPAKRCLAEVCRQGHDSFLVWNFFDAALQRKGTTRATYSKTPLKGCCKATMASGRFKPPKKCIEWWRILRALRWLYERGQQRRSNRHPGTQCHERDSQIEEQDLSGLLLVHSVLALSPKVNFNLQKTTSLRIDMGRGEAEWQQTLLLCKCATTWLNWPLTSIQ